MFSQNKDIKRRLKDFLSGQQVILLLSAYAKSGIKHGDKHGLTAASNTQLTSPLHSWKRLNWTQSAKQAAACQKQMVQLNGQLCHPYPDAFYEAVMRETCEKIPKVVFQLVLVLKRWRSLNSRTIFPLKEIGQLRDAGDPEQKSDLLINDSR